MISVGRTSEVRGPNNVISSFKVREFAQNLAYLLTLLVPIMCITYVLTFPSIIVHFVFLNLPKFSLSLIFPSVFNSYSRIAHLRQKKIFNECNLIYYNIGG